MNCKTGSLYSESATIGKSPLQCSLGGGGFVHSAHSVGTVAHCQGGMKGTRMLMSLGGARHAVDLIKFGLILFSLIKWP